MSLAACTASCAVPRSAVSAPGKDDTSAIARSPWAPCARRRRYEKTLWRCQLWGPGARAPRRTTIIYFFRFTLSSTKSDGCQCSIIYSGRFLDSSAVIPFPPQTMSHIVDTCPLTKFEGGLNLLHEMDDDAVIWLEATATAALAK